ncbi:uncharacterized protein A4U43_C08F35660 [Asparagus officinalis]|uniref:transcription factor EMB1444-like n=1 Tax=Asparagus officinalis TaxID=4686 RepID=UPI00098E3896|nr:transcription factor EMB1444-like [Asparagus officinalis]ONK61989.1 uncharacterized protein A4U43_C08F35660 [Asparagus officinalis]
MGTANTTALRQLLRGLCQNSHWNYALLWKLKGTRLFWDDCYFDDEHAGGFLNEELGFISFSSQINTSRNSAKWLIEKAVVSLSCLSYPLGEGITGKVASQRKHHWAYCDKIASRMLEGFPEEWNPQTMVGIKTILLVPVIPLGVVQLGSMDMVFEDLREVVRIRDYFDIIQNTSQSHTSLSPSTDCLHSCMPLVLSPDNFPLPVDALDQILGADIGAYADESKWQSMFSNLFEDHTEEPPTFDLPLFGDCISEFVSSSSLQDELHVISSISPTLISRDPIIPKLFAEDLGHADHNGHNFTEEFDAATNSIVDLKPPSFQYESELQEALGLSLEEFDDCIDGIVSKADEWRNSMAFCQKELPEVCNPIFEDADALFPKERGTEQLLDAVIAKLLDTSYDNEPSESGHLSLWSNSSSKCSDSCLTHYKIENDVLNLGESVSLSCKRSMIASENEGFPNSPARSSIKRSIDVQLSKEEQETTYKRYKKGSKLTNITVKRGDAKDMHKPKPRDRQLIQERIKQLRELIPDGSKCSIDSLLNRTIKHMLFLESIPHQAEMLRHSAETKIGGAYHNSSGYRTCRNGASWAYEMGNNSKQCPLIVEELEPPGQLLVEMQCEDYELFLDIAQVVRRLKLSILKGILQVKSNKPRAHFILETPKGFNRMEILWPLVRLLQRNNVPTTQLL